MHNETMLLSASTCICKIIALNNLPRKMSTAIDLNDLPRKVKYHKTRILGNHNCDCLIELWI